jgi:hypothetical protein
MLFKSGAAFGSPDCSFLAAQPLLYFKGVRCVGLAAGYHLYPIFFLSGAASGLPDFSFCLDAKRNKKIKAWLLGGPL